MCSAPYELWQPVQGCLELHITVAARARREDLNVLVVLRAMGCQSDAEALLHIGAEPAFEPLLAATLQDARQPGQPGHQRNTQAAALEWLGAAPGASPRRRSSFTSTHGRIPLVAGLGEPGTAAVLARGSGCAPRPAPSLGRGRRAARAGSKVKQSVGAEPRVWRRAAARRRLRALQDGRGARPARQRRPLPHRLPALRLPGQGAAPGPDPSPALRCAFPERARPPP